MISDEWKKIFFDERKCFPGVVSVNSLELVRKASLQDSVWNMTVLKSASSLES